MQIEDFNVHFGQHFFQSSEHKQRPNDQTLCETINNYF